MFVQHAAKALGYEYLAGDSGRLAPTDPTGLARGGDVALGGRTFLRFEGLERPFVTVSALVQGRGMKCGVAHAQRPDRSDGRVRRGQSLGSGAGAGLRGQTSNPRCPLKAALGNVSVSLGVGSSLTPNRGPTPTSGR